MFSARRYQGKRLYKLARKGMSVTRQKKVVTIKALELLSFDYPLASFRICCDRGTYVRVLCDDLGKVSGLGAHLHHLLRESLGPFSLEQAVTLEDLSARIQAGSLGSAFVSMNDTIGFLPVVVLSDKELNRITFGNAVRLTSGSGEGTAPRQNSLFRIVSEKKELKAIGKIQALTLPIRKDCDRSLYIQPICVL